MKIDLTKLKRLNLVKDMERDNDVAMGSFYVGGIDQKHFERMGVPFGIKTQITLSNREIFYDKKELDAAKEFLLRKGAKLPQFAQELTQRFTALAKNYERFLRKNKKKDFQTVSPTELQKVYQEYLEHIYNLIPYSNIVSNILESVARGIILHDLQNYADPQKTYAQLIIPRKLNKTSEEYRARLELAALYKINNPSFTKKVRDHLHKFGWISYFRPMDETIIEEDFLREGKNLATNGDPAQNLEKLQEEQRKAMAIANQLEKNAAGKPSHVLIGVMRDNAWLRTYRRELMSMGFRELRSMYHAIAKTLGYSFTDLKYLACWEITELLQEKKKISQEEIKLRKQAFAVLRISGQMDVLSGKEAQDLMTFKEDLSIEKVFKGQAASPGKVRGIAAVVNAKEDLKSFKRGSILVTHEVMLWMTPIIESSVGIIAESGRILSHTGIIAREFRKPCVVGIRNASKIFKDGTEVEIDAEQGMVRIRR